MGHVAAHRGDPPGDPVRKHRGREKPLASFRIAPERERVEKRTREGGGLRDPSPRSVNGWIVGDLPLYQKLRVEADLPKSPVEPVGGTGRAADAIERAEEDGPHEAGAQSRDGRGI